MSMSFFTNAIRCPNGAHNHGLGYSCAIDSFLEVYYYGMYLRENTLQGVDLPFIGQLNSLSQRRCATQSASCELRESIWDLLVSQRPAAFGPKGTVNANVDVAFDLLINYAPSFFNPITQGVSHCYGCQQNTQMTSDHSMFLFIHDLSVSVHGQLPTGMELQIQKKVSHQAVCSTCHFQTYIEGAVYMPNFLIVDLCLHDDKNVAEPATVLAEQILVFDIHYELTGAILKQPQHFLSAVKNRTGYAMINDLSTQIEYFPTFSSLVSQNGHRRDTFHVLSPSDKAVSILVYQRIGQNNVVPFNRVMRHIPVYTQNTAPVTEIMRL